MALSHGCSRPCIGLAMPACIPCTPPTLITHAPCIACTYSACTVHRPCTHCTTSLNSGARDRHGDRLLCTNTWRGWTKPLLIMISSSSTPHCTIHVMLRYTNRCTILSIKLALLTFNRQSCHVDRKALSLCLTFAQIRSSIKLRNITIY